MFIAKMANKKQIYQLSCILPDSHRFRSVISHSRICSQMSRNSTVYPSYSSVTLRKKLSYSELFWFVFSCIWTKYEVLRSKSWYSVWMWENKNQNNSKYGHFLYSLAHVILFHRTHDYIQWQIIYRLRYSEIIWKNKKYFFQRNMESIHYWHAGIF